MTKEYKWLFPSGSVGITGINHSGIETFKDHPIPSLGREICQNSGDAVNDKDKPVIVEFHLFKILYLYRIYIIVLNFIHNHISIFRSIKSKASISI